MGLINTYIVQHVTRDQIIASLFERQVLVIFVSLYLICMVLFNPTKSGAFEHLNLYLMHCIH